VTDPPRDADATRRALDARDRDAAGRPLNARARDPKTGRPLGRASRRAQLAEQDAATALPPEDALAEAERLVLDGRPFFAHEVLEGPWHLAEPALRDFWQGLAQVAVGLTHVQRGNPVGAVTLLRRGAERLGAYDEGTYGVAVTRVVADATALANRVERDGLDAVTEASLRIAFRG
jgi:hypothetical protein